MWKLNQSKINPQTLVISIENLGAADALTSIIRLKFNPVT